MTDLIDDLPILVLSPHARCNCRCLMCDIWKIKEPAEISNEEIEAWLPEWTRLGVSEVVLTGGEALMHSDLFALSRTLKEAGVSITLLTSGLLLSRDAEEIGRFVDRVLASLDGPREIHDEIRNVPRAFDRLAEGVAALKVKAPHVPVGARCTVQRRNARHLMATVDAARAIGLAKISFLAADVTSEAFNRPGGWDETATSGVALSPDDLLALEEELQLLENQHASDFASGFIAESPAKLRARLLQHFAALLGRGDFAPVRCNAPWVSSVIEADGTVRPCFFHVPLGNVREAGSLSAVLNSEKARAFRSGLDVSTNPVCRRCVCSLHYERERGLTGAASMIAGREPASA